MFRRSRVLFAPEGTAAPSGAQPAAAAVVPAVAAPAPAAAVVSADAPPVAADGTVDPNWLNGRLERERAKERSKLLKEIGVSDPAAAAKLVADEAARVAAARTLEVKVADSETALATERARVAALSTTISVIATERMAGLTEAQRAAVTAVAGDDAAAQVRTIAALAPTWVAAAPATAVAVAPGAAPAAPAPPASGTAPPAAAAPAPNVTVSQTDHKAEYAALKKTNPHAASLYLNKHHGAIYPSS